MRAGRGRELGRRTRRAKEWPLLPANVWANPGLVATARGKGDRSLALAVEKEILGIKSYALPVLVLDIGPVTVSSSMKWGDHLTVYGYQQD